MAFPSSRIAVYFVTAESPSRYPLGTMDGPHDRPEEYCVSMPSQCHAQDPWVCCALFE